MKIRGRNTNSSKEPNTLLSEVNNEGYMKSNTFELQEGKLLKSRRHTKRKEPSDKPSENYKHYKSCKTRIVQSRELTSERNNLTNILI